MATKAVVALFVTTSMLHAGLGLSVAEVLRPLRNPRVVTGALVGNFVLVPLAAMGLARLFDLSDGLHLGLLLIAMSAGGPFLPRLVELGRGNAALGVAVMTLLLTATLVYLPLVLPRFAPGVEVEAWAIAKPVFLLMLTPLVAGMALRVWLRPWLFAHLARLLDWISRAVLIALLILLVAVDTERVASVLGSGALAAAALLVISAMGIGLVMGGASGERRRVLALATGQRGISAALLIATHVAQDPDAAVMVVVLILVGELILFPVAAAMGRWPGAEG